MINLWRCYALRHHYELLLDTDDADIQAHFRSPNWIRWFTADKYLPYYDSLLIVDPDEYVVPQCWDIDVIALLDKMMANKSIACREFFYPQTLNDGVLYVRNTPMAHFFLRLFLDKVGWWQPHAADQGAFDETVLEMAGMEVALRANETASSYLQDCFPLTFPTRDRSHVAAFYTICWYFAMRDLVGDGGERQMTHIAFIDPRVVDINHVVGVRGLEPNALIYHFAGRGKQFADILDNFGVDPRITGNCVKVHAYVDSMTKKLGCTPFNEGVVNTSSYCPPPMHIC
eukprot:GEMP01037731.1.p1 GENE.GEMP01037731.1~~GEMP01037731.1.p1  ORF type:complete len:286 (+),score=64.82 GEMP01037731.1:779-1636(+)